MHERPSRVSSIENSDDAYEGAWKVLEDNYGNPFVVQKAFRDALVRPKVDPNDPLALRDFADFLKGCVEAMPHVRGLSVLNNTEENHHASGAGLWWKNLTNLATIPALNDLLSLCRRRRA